VTLLIGDPFSVGTALWDFECPYSRVHGATLKDAWRNGGMPDWLRALLSKSKAGAPARRRIAFPKAKDHAFLGSITAGFGDKRNGVRNQFARSSPKPLMSALGH
jgi:hypothetical protein